VVQSPSPTRRRLARGEATSSKPDGAPDYRQSQQNQTIRFLLILAGTSSSCSICVATHFGDSTGELTTSSMSRMKGENSDHNRSDLDKGNILKPTFDTLMEEGHKVFEAYHTNLEELFLSHCKVTRQGTVLKDTTLIVFTKPEVMLEVRPNPSPPLNDVQNMINSALERQAKSTDELLRRLIDKRDGKKLDTTSVNSLLISLKPIHTQVVHRRVAHQCQTPLSSR
jgi:hypothetical protein